MTTCFSPVSLGVMEVMTGLEDEGELYMLIACWKRALRSCFSCRWCSRKLAKS